jgi:hypothetical protein
MTSLPTITLAIPAYGRPDETAGLLESILASSALPEEVLLCEDLSPQRDRIRSVVDGFRERFAAAGTTLTFHENEVNLGFDRNLKELVRRASGDWVVWMGNDDTLLQDGVAPIRSFLASHPSVRFLSCAYEPFDGETGRAIHVQRYFPQDHVESSDTTYVFKLSSFISGVAVQRRWALDKETSQFDGGLFYQVYLSASAFAEGGIGYVSTPTVGSRRGGTPLFGSASTEKQFHTPGRIVAKGRTSMYASVLEIARHVDSLHGTRIHDGIVRELDSRQIFHVYESFAGRPRRETLELFRSLREIGLGRSAIHKAFFATAYLGGSAAPVLFRLARRARDGR